MDLLSVHGPGPLGSNPQFRPGVCLRIPGPLEYLPPSACLYVSYVCHYEDSARMLLGCSRALRHQTSDIITHTSYLGPACLSPSRLFIFVSSASLQQTPATRENGPCSAPSSYGPFIFHFPKFLILSADCRYRAEHQCPRWRLAVASVSSPPENQPRKGKYKSSGHQSCLLFFSQEEPRSSRVPL